MVGRPTSAGRAPGPPNACPASGGIVVALAAVLLAAGAAPASAGPEKPDAARGLAVDLPGLEDRVVLTSADPRSPDARAKAPSAAEGLLAGRTIGANRLIHLADTPHGTLGVADTPTGPTWVTVDEGTIVPAEVETRALPRVDDGSARAPAGPQVHGSPSPNDDAIQVFVDGDVPYWWDTRDRWDEHQLAVFHLVDAIYRANVGIPVEVVGQHVWRPSEPRPVTAKHFCAAPDGQPSLLRQFRHHYEATNPTRDAKREAAQLLTGRVPARYSGCGYLRQLDTRGAYAVSETQIDDGPNPLYQDEILAAHELGHNANGRHFLSIHVGCAGTIMAPACSSTPTFSGLVLSGDCEVYGYECGGEGNAQWIERYARKRT